MLTSVVAGIRNVRQYPELQGARVLVTGISNDSGYDVARAFAEAGCRMVVQIGSDGSDDGAARSAAMLQTLANTAAEIRASELPIENAAAAVRFAQGAAQAFGGLDVVVNVIVPDLDAVGEDATVAEIEDAVSDTLQQACLVTRVAANRMNLTWTEGLILNAVLVSPAADETAMTFNAILRQALAAMTRVEASNWADKGVRINAVGPRGLGELSTAAGKGLASEADIAALALYLASKRGRTLSGHVFDAEAVATRAC